MFRIFVFWLLFTLFFGALYNNSRNIACNWKNLLKWFTFGVLGASIMSLIVLIF